MQNSSAKATFIGWLDLSFPDQKLHFDLVQVLYRTPKSIFGATIVSLLVIAIAGAMSGDSAYGFFGLCTCRSRAYWNHLSLQSRAARRRR